MLQIAVVFAELESGINFDLIEAWHQERTLDDVLREGDWQPLLDRETWDPVRAVLLDPTRRTNTGNEHRWLLARWPVRGREVAS